MTATAPVVLPPALPAVTVAHTIFPNDNVVTAGLVECCMWEGEGEKICTNIRVGQYQKAAAGLMEVLCLLLPSVHSTLQAAEFWLLLLLLWWWWWWWW